MSTRPPGFWTLEKCAEVARKYETKKEFSRANRSAYTTAHRNGWLDQICEHMTPLRKPDNYWTKERCIKAAKKFKTRHEFQKGDISPYITAHREGWLDEVCAHMTLVKRPKDHWTLPMLREEAAKYQTRNAFALGSTSAYMAARNQDVLDDVCKHMKSIGNKTKRYVYLIRNRALNIGYIGLALDPHERYEQHKKSGRLASLFDSEHEMVVLSPLLSAQAAADMERKLIKQYRKDGWTLLNRKAGGGLGGGHLIWTKELVFECGRKCATRKQFMEEFETAYSTAKRGGWLDEIFANHPMKGFAVQWTLDRHIRARKPTV